MIVIPHDFMKQVMSNKQTCFCFADNITSVVAAQLLHTLTFVWYLTQPWEYFD